MFNLSFSGLLRPVNFHMPAVQNLETGTAILLKRMRVWGLSFLRWLVRNGGKRPKRKLTTWALILTPLGTEPNTLLLKILAHPTYQSCLPVERQSLWPQQWTCSMEANTCLPQLESFSTIKWMISHIQVATNINLMLFESKTLNMENECIRYLAFKWINLIFSLQY